MQGAGDGAVDQWINILDEIAKLAEPSGLFLPALKRFLTQSAIGMGPLLTSWAKGRATSLPTISVVAKLKSEQRCGT